MVGVTSSPKLNTKQDFENNYQARLSNGEADPLKDYKWLYNSRMNWFNVMDDVETEVEDPITNDMVTQTTQVPHTVASIEEGIVDETHRIVQSGTEEEPVLIQQELRLDSNSLMFLKGFTLEEIEGILGL